MLDADVEVDRREFTVRVALQVASGERLALFGPSGAGKTTLLEVIAGLVAPRRGRIELGSRVLTSTAPPVRAVPPWVQLQATLPVVAVLLSMMLEIVIWAGAVG